MASLAQRNSKRLVGLVTEFLDLEKTELGKVDFNLEPLDLAEVLNDALSTNQGFAYKHGIDLALGEVPHVAVFADPDRLQQVLSNLLSNAIKFSPSGEVVRIEAHRLEGSQHNENKVRISVIDQGPGIPEEFRPYLFDKFSQAQSDGKRKHGSGLGLALAKAYVEGMQGQLHLDLQESLGTIFHMDMPMSEK